MAKKKTPIKSKSKGSKDLQELQSLFYKSVSKKIKKSTQNKIYYIDKKLNKKPKTKDKIVLEKELLKLKKSIGKKDLTKSEEVRYKKEKISISSKKTRINKKILSGKLTKKELNKLRREALSLNKRLTFLKKSLKEKVKRQKKKKKPARSSKGVIVFTEPIWVVRVDYLEPAMKSKKVKFIIIGTKKFKRSQTQEIIMAWLDMEVKALSLGISTPHIQITIDKTNMITSFTLDF